MCSNASITEILGINDNNLVILGNKKENIKGIEYTVLRGKLSYRPTCCPKCGIVNENYDITKNGSHTVKILLVDCIINRNYFFLNFKRIFCHEKTDLPIVRFLGLTFGGRYKAVSSSLGMKIKRIRPYSPWQNGKVKRSSFVFKNLNYYVII